METNGQQSPPERPEEADASDQFIEVRFTVPKDLHRRIQELAAQEGWPADEALLTVISHGAAYVAGQAEVARINRGEADVREQAEKFHSMAMQLDGSNAVMKFRAYTLGVAVQTLEWNVTGLRGEHQLATKRLEIYRASEQELKDQLITLQRENGRLANELAKVGVRRLESEPVGAGPSASVTITRGLRFLLQRTRGAFPFRTQNDDRR